jgi:hypothetical protein
MKQLFLFFMALALFSCTPNQMLVQIPAGDRVELNTPGTQLYSAEVKNKSLGSLEVGVLSKNKEQQIRGFGLSAEGKADVLVESDNKLVLRNGSAQPAKVRVVMSKTEPVAPMPAGSVVNFTLRNKTARSIPLLIPDVMNPNLSPFSKSGVNLVMGQEILFQARGKKYVLLKVDESILEGSEIDVAALLKTRKAELGL